MARPHQKFNLVKRHSDDRQATRAWQGHLSPSSDQMLACRFIKHRLFSTQDPPIEDCMGGFKERRGLRLNNAKARRIFGSADGLPQGVQCISDRWRDDLALAAAADIEAALGTITPIDPVTG